MSYQGVKFEDEASHYSSRVILGASQTPKVITWMMKVGNGFIKTERQAAYFIFILVIIMLVVSTFLFFGGSRKQKTPKVMPPEYKKQLESY